VFVEIQSFLELTPKHVHAIEGMIYICGRFPILARIHFEVIQVDIEAEAATYQLNKEEVEEAIACIAQRWGLFRQTLDWFLQVYIVMDAILSLDGTESGESCDRDAAGGDTMGEMD